MFYANIYTKFVWVFFVCLFVLFFCLVYAETKNHSFSAGAIFVVCRDLKGLPMQAHQDRLMKKELSSGFSSLPQLEDILWQHLSAGWHCAPLRLWRRESLSLEHPSPGANSTVCTALLPVHCHTSVTLLQKYPFCLSFIRKFSSFININLKYFAGG